LTAHRWPGRHGPPRFVHLPLKHRVRRSTVVLSLLFVLLVGLNIWVRPSKARQVFVPYIPAPTTTAPAPPRTTPATRTTPPATATTVPPTIIAPSAPGSTVVASTPTAPPTSTTTSTAPPVTASTTVPATSTTAPG
jgi:cytoskeletal protein RodZ